MSSVDEKASVASLRVESPKHEDVKSNDTIASDRRLLRKLDWNLLPLVSLMHLLSFLDRSNFGNAKAAGMEKSLHLGPYGFNIAAALFYIFYAAFEIPSNLLMKRIGPQKWFPFQMIAWGIVCTLICLTKDFTGLILVRIFLGITEAGLFPGLNLYISHWYQRRELAQRIAIFYASTTSSGAFGGILCYGLIKMDGVGGMDGWRWIFAIEGIVTVVVGVFCFWGMYGLPEDATFLTGEERRRVLERLAEDPARREMNTYYDTKFVLQAFTDWKTWLFSTIYIGTLIPVYALSLFLPSIITNLGWKAADAQLLSTPPYILAMCVALVSAWFSDRYFKRGPFVLATQLLALIGFCVLISTEQARYGYMGVFFTCTGTYSTIPVLISWASGNTGGDTKRSVRLAIMIGVGNLGGICSSFVYRNQDRPRYHLGHTVMIAVLCMACTATIVGMFTFDQLNKKKEALCQEQKIDDSRVGEFRDAGDDSPLFRFSI